MAEQGLFLRELQVFTYKMFEKVNNFLKTVSIFNKKWLYTSQLTNNS